MNGLRIRPMRPDEVSLAVDWAAAEGWNPGLADDACFAAADPEGFFIGELEGAPAATISCINYGTSFAFLGFYIVREDLRGRGYGLQIWSAAIAHAQPTFPVPIIPIFTASHVSSDRSIHCRPHASGDS